MTRIEREKQTVQRMIELYCHHHLKVETIPEEYQHLAEFACRRLDHCKYGENKTACKNCPTHCYDAIVHTFYNVKHWLQSLSFRTGVIVLLCCIPFYLLSFAQMLLPISVTAKGILWTVLFGLAKTCQYGGLTILGVEGYKRLKDKFKHKN